MSLAKRSYEKELLDKDDIPFNDILKTMQELNVINTFLGGHSITRDGVAAFIDKVPATVPVSIAEIGCGGGDNLTTVYKFLKQKDRSVTLTGIDIKEECIQFAKQRAAQPTTWICSDYRTVLWPGPQPHIIFSSLFCHHFTDEQLLTQLAWLKANSRTGFFINDLHRHPVAYHSIKLLTKFFSKSALVKNDGPLSVKRAFKKADWQRLLAAAGITNYTIKWKWAFRYLISVPHEQ